MMAEIDKRKSKREATMLGGRPQKNLPASVGKFKSNERNPTTAVETATKFRQPLFAASVGNVNSLAELSRVGGDGAGRAGGGLSITLDGGTRIIGIDGPLAKNLSHSERQAGLVDYFDLVNAIEEASDSENVERIVLRVDSPGGFLDGLTGAVRAVRRCSKPTVAFVDGLAEGAAYALAASCGRVVANQTAEVGGVGVAAVYADQSRALEREGIKVEIVQAGQFKTAGHPSKPLQDAERAHLQTLVDAQAEVLFGMVSSGRGLSVCAVEALGGKSYLASEAKNLRLVDEVGEFDSALKSVRKIKSSTGISAASRPDDWRVQNLVSWAERAPDSDTRDRRLAAAEQLRERLAKNPR